MIVSNGSKVSARNCFGSGEDLSFIVGFNWKNVQHVRAAIEVLLAARLNKSVQEKSVIKECPGECHEALTEDELEHIRMRIASNPNTPPVVLEYLSKQGSVSVHERVAENPQVLESTLERLAGSPDGRVRSAVAQNASTPSHILDMLASDPDVDVRYASAENPYVREHTLDALMQDTNPYVSHRAGITLMRLSGGKLISAPFPEPSQEINRLSSG